MRRGDVCEDDQPPDMTVGTIVQLTERVDVDVQPMGPIGFIHPRVGKINHLTTKPRRKKRD